MGECYFWYRLTQVARTKGCKMVVVVVAAATAAVVVVYKCSDWFTYLHCVSKNVPPLTCYNLDMHYLSMIIFGGSVTKKVRNQKMLCFPTSPIWCFCITLRNRKPRNSVFSLKHCTLCCQQTQKTFKLSPGRCWITLHSQTWSTVCIRQLKPT